MHAILRGKEKSVPRRIYLMVCGYVFAAKHGKKPGTLEFTGKKSLHGVPEGTSLGIGVFILGRQKCYGIESVRVRRDYHRNSSARGCPVGRCAVTVKIWMRTFAPMGAFLTTDPIGRRFWLVAGNLPVSVADVSRLIGKEAFHGYNRWN